MDRNDEARKAFFNKQHPKAPQMIGIGIPSGDEFKANFGMALAAMTYFSGLRGINVGLFNQKGSILPTNRNGLAREALNYNCSHLLQLDWDMTFPPNTLHRLMSHNKDIVGCTYPRRSEPHDNLCVPLNRERVDNASGVIEVDRLPTGILLIKTEVFRKIKKPWFRFVTIEECEEHPDGAIHGEDFYFCDAAREAGFKVYLDVQLSFDVTHWGEQGFQLTDTPPGSPPGTPRYKRVELPSAVLG